MGMKSSGGGGDIVQVQGGHIIRSTGRKDRHSKVYTAKGPRDRRVRLSAHTAIQFYDVQDRLGCDRPSKALDWLINKAKNAIDKLAELPPWDPNDIIIASRVGPNEGSSGMPLEQQHRPLGENPVDNPSFRPPSNICEPMEHTMKSFFPASSGTPSTNFQDYPDDIMSRPSIQTQDLCLSLHSLQGQNSSHTPQTDQALYYGAAPLAFESSYQRTMSWNSGGDAENRGMFVFNSQTMPQQSQLCQSSAFSLREPLQSSYSQRDRAWVDLPLPSVDHPNVLAMHQSLICSSQFNTSEFQVPTRIHGEVEIRAVSNNPSDASPRMN
ncbi:unnamed protein product [Ilex paraguariensis]|uniref:TCP domain-containing protein n=1 Tax=Ilex paraguariensis TaxID=185542 RepID=A0ABC8RQB7_9AQUA